VGVTKAAIYHQFKTKDDIVLCAAAASMISLERAVDAAEAAPDRERALDLLLTHYIDIAVHRRHFAAILQNDPVMVRFVARHEPFRALMDRFFDLLVDDDSDETRVRAAMLSGGINAAAIHPLVDGLDDDALRSHLLRMARRLAADGATTS
jgi:AcrR family transcriptional regulator